MSDVGSGIEGLLSEKGDLHDCRIIRIEWEMQSDRLEIGIADFNENYLGLPEYSGLQPGCLIFDGVKSIRFDASSPGEGLRIFEAAVSAEGGLPLIEFLLSPSGRLAVHCSSARYE